MVRTIKLMAIALAFSGLASCDKNDPDPNALTCTSPTIAGNYSIGAALTSANTITVPVTVNTTGAYTITTNTVNGMTFSYTGAFTTTGTQYVTLTGSGTPSIAGTSSFIPEIVGPHPIGGSSCGFDVQVQ